MTIMMKLFWDQPFDNTNPHETNIILNVMSKYDEFKGKLILVFPYSCGLKSWLGVGFSKFC